jgi:hypothetical protein
MAKSRKVRAGEEFVFCNGTKAATLAQCRAELRKLTPEQFAHHVNAEKNDIHAWLRDCLDVALAGRIRGIRDRDALIKALEG